MEEFLRQVLPRVLPEEITWTVHPMGGKARLLSRLGARLRGYARWMPEGYRLVIVLDRDDDDCRTLKARVEHDIAQAGLTSRSEAAGEPWQAVSRLAIEELEAWYFGDWHAVRRAYPRVSATVPDRQRYRDPDAVPGGTWEAFERILKRSGYFRGGLRKLEAARAIGRHVRPERNTSTSFQQLRSVLIEVAASANPVAEGG